MRLAANRGVAVVMATLAFCQAFPFAALCSTAIDRKEYVWDAASRVTSAKEGGVWSYYEYDAIDQLIEEEKPALSYLTTYTYDANGNRLTRTVNSVTEDYVYDDADKLLTVSVNSAVVKEFSYDAAGRTTAIETSAGITSFAYDYESRVTSITYPNSTSDSHTYNALGARVGSSGANGSKTFRRAGIGVTSSVLDDGTRKYTPGVSSRSGSTSTFQHSGLKNATEQSSSSQSTTASRQYDAFGNLTSSSGSWQGAFGYGGDYGYQSDANGLKLLGHRYYDSTTGRFITSDPIGDGGNWYSYCYNSPLSQSDPNGLTARPDLARGLALFEEDVAIAMAREYSRRIPKLAKDILLYSAKNPSVVTRGAGAASTVLHGGQYAVRSANMPIAVRFGHESYAYAGQRMHNLLSGFRGHGYSVNETISGSRLRPDLVNHTTRMVAELKPNNSRAIALGARQLNAYIAELERITGNRYSGVILTYDWAIPLKQGFTSWGSLNFGGHRL